jgi:alpha-ribazole phosphatase
MLKASPGRPKLEVYFVRHPRPAVPPGVCYGSTDLGLAEDASLVAARLLPALPRHLPLFASPLGRCRALAERLHPAPIYDERLKEMNFGDWELRPWSELPRSELDAWAASPLDYAPPGGEPVSALKRRVAAFVADRSVAGDASIIVVSHAGVLKVLAAELAGHPFEVWSTLTLDFGAMRRIDTGLATSA